MSLGPWSYGREMKLTNRDQETQWDGEFTFVVAADTQLGFIADPSWDDGGQDNGTTWEEEIELAERFVACVNKMAPRPRCSFVSFVRHCCAAAV